MTTFDKREEAFERQFVHDEGVRFKALARRNKRLGLWAAERLGRTGTEAESYAKVLAAIELQHHSDAEVASKIQRDLEAAGVSISEAEIRHLMGELLAKAIAEIKDGRWALDALLICTGPVETDHSRPCFGYSFREHLSEKGIRSIAVALEPPAG